jgi:hypothetical protein
VAWALGSTGHPIEQGEMTMPGQTTVAIDDERFLINGEPTYRNRSFAGQPVEGLLFNARMVQGIFDDENPATVDRWAYPDTGRWDAERNTAEFVAAMPEWRAHGLLGISLNLQGGSPEGYSRQQPWVNSAIAADGSLKPAYLNRLSQILAAADRLGMVVILGCYYFGQDERVRDEAAVIAGVEATASWLLDGGHTNVILEINNECDVPRYEHAILRPERVHELIERVRGIDHHGRRLLVGTSFRGRSVPTEAVIAVSDLALLHGNGVVEPAYIAEQVARTRQLATYRPMPIVYNEDDHFDFDAPLNNLGVAFANYASWGFFDPGEGAGGSAARGDYRHGYQLVPVNWSLSTERKRAFFATIRRLTGAA